MVIFRLSGVMSQYYFPISFSDFQVNVFQQFPPHAISLNLAIGKAAQAITFLPSTREVLYSNLGWHPENLEGKICHAVAQYREGALNQVATAFPTVGLTSPNAITLLYLRRQIMAAVDMASLCKLRFVHLPNLV
jgi:hypothetical protein